ncbi:hypothetical protein [Cribrihabitans neustonicus]|uniref:hypothetical protein n=1 Tax=Cribrihabitans neustonicus TaxID=1429085 RepID=UPI003B5C321D
MPHSKFKRPPGFEGIQTDPEESYRAGYQHGARTLLRFLEASPDPDYDGARAWIETDLGGWRHDTQAEPVPPAP